MGLRVLRTARRWLWRHLCGTIRVGEGLSPGPRPLWGHWPGCGRSVRGKQGRGTHDPLAMLPLILCFPKWAQSHLPPTVLGQGMVTLNFTPGPPAQGEALGYPVCHSLWSWATGGRVGGDPAPLLPLALPTWLPKAPGGTQRAGRCPDRLLCSRPSSRSCSALGRACFFQEVSWVTGP